MCEFNSFSFVRLKFSQPFSSQTACLSSVLSRRLAQWLGGWLPHLLAGHPLQLESAIGPPGYSQLLTQSVILRLCFHRNHRGWRSHVLIKMCPHPESKPWFPSRFSLHHPASSPVHPIAPHPSNSTLTIYISKLLSVPIKFNLFFYFIFLRYL